MSIEFTEIYLHDNCPVTFSCLNGQEREQVQASREQTELLLGHLLCPYHPQSRILLLLCLDNHQINTTVYACCLPFSGILKHTLRNSPHAYQLFCQQDINLSASN